MGLAEVVHPPHPPQWLVVLGLPRVQVLLVVGMILLLLYHGLGREVALGQPLPPLVAGLGEELVVEGR